MELEYEGHVSCKSENDEDALYESSLTLGDNEPTVSIPITSYRRQTVNCEHGRPAVGSPEELVEAESYTEPDKWEESFHEDTVVVEAYPTMENNNNNGKEQELSSSSSQQKSCGLEASLKYKSKSSVTKCLRNFSPLCWIIQRERDREALLLLCQVLGVEDSDVVDISGLKERILNLSIRQPLDAFNFQRVESILKQWDSERLEKLACLLQVKKEDDQLVENIMQRLDNLEIWTSQQEEEDLPKKKQKRNNASVQ